MSEKTTSFSDVWKGWGQFVILIAVVCINAGVNINKLSSVESQVGKLDSRIEKQSEANSARYADMERRLLEAKTSLSTAQGSLTLMSDEVAKVRREYLEMTTWIKYHDELKHETRIRWLERYKDKTAKE